MFHVGIPHKSIFFFRESSLSKVLGKAYICNFFSGCQQNKVALTTTSTTTNPVYLNENDGDEYLNVKCAFYKYKYW